MDKKDFPGSLVTFGPQLEPRNSALAVYDRIFQEGSNVIAEAPAAEASPVEKQTREKVKRKPRDSHGHLVPFGVHGLEPRNSALAFYERIYQKGLDVFAGKRTADEKRNELLYKRNELLRSWHKALEKQLGHRLSTEKFRDDYLPALISQLRSKSENGVTKSLERRREHRRLAESLIGPKCEIIGYEQVRKILRKNQPKQ